MQKPTFPPTPEQQAIIDATAADRRSLMVNAYAGCAKTTTLVMLASRVSGPALAVAFNVKIKKELEARFPSNFTVKTLNGLGHSAWGRAIGKRLTLDDRKLGRLVSAALKDLGQQGDKDLWGDVRRLVVHATHAGLTPRETPIGRGLIPDTPAQWEELAFSAMLPEAAIPAAKQALLAKVREALGGVIDFDDQVYMSALFGGQFDRYPTVIVDEAQDLSPLNHIQLRRSAADRLIVVGDPKQAIYGFRGADHSSMDSLRELRNEWIDLPLRQTFRCPHAIVARQQEHAPGFVATPQAPHGTVAEWGEWDAEALRSLPDVAVLCRNNAPLLALAFKLLRQRLGAVFLGRDLGRNLIGLSKKIAPSDEATASEVRTAIDSWFQTQASLALANDQEHKLEGLTDRKESLLAVLDGSGAQTAGALRKALTELFAKDRAPVTLATGHRSKGLEWATVVHLDPFRVPSQRAQRAGGAALLQELNLRYVIETRAKHTLVMANLEDFTDTPA